ncbi:hypothetical protein J1N35_010939 [Gossypium stocksii]|uniref:Uncharacterized protein n=1 Tax=Gossypium stocksii TaxID=47602 RepID=A0A9D3W1C8_9ROSI|nr:hypothetical protein J1N35_010939 [Gossypium stocksii]
MYTVTIIYFPNVVPGGLLTGMYHLMRTEYGVDQPEEVSFSSSAKSKIKNMVCWGRRFRCRMRSLSLMKHYMSRVRKALERQWFSVSNLRTSFY